MSIPKRILVPLDFSEPSMRALAYAKTLGEAVGASLELLHVVPNPYVADPSGLYMALPQNLLDDFEREARARLDETLTSEERKTFKAQSTVRTGDPLVAIVEHARVTPIDLIVMGTHGRTGVSHFFVGSVAERVVRSSPCPVLTVR
jgi:nucleotide-binding universal stress UspA family protein